MVFCYWLALFPPFATCFLGVLAFHWVRLVADWAVSGLVYDGPCFGISVSVCVGPGHC